MSTTAMLLPGPMYSKTTVGGVVDPGGPSTTSTCSESTKMTCPSALIVMTTSRSSGEFCSSIGRARESEELSAGKTTAVSITSWSMGRVIRTRTVSATIPNCDSDLPSANW